MVTYTLAGDTEAITGYADLVVVRQGTIVAAYQLLGNGTAFPAALEQAAIGAAVARGEAAAGR